MWIKTTEARILNLDSVERLYAEEENGEFKITALTIRGKYQNVRKCKTLDEAQQKVDYLLSILDADRGICHMDGAPVSDEPVPEPTPTPVPTPVPDEPKQNEKDEPKDEPTPAPEPTGKLLGKSVVNATADGELAKYTITRLLKCIPNKTDVRFKITLFCPTGAKLEESELQVSDFTTGREWGNGNSYAKTIVSATDGGTTYVLDWTEHVSVEEYLWDDDAANNLLTYYCCSEAHVTGTGDLTKCTLTVQAYAA